MLKITSLFSGSSGNSYLIESNNSKILIDAGKSGIKIEKQLAKLNIDIKDIKGIVLSHEHNDHMQSLFILSKRHNIPVYISEETIKNLEIKTPEELVFTFNKKNNFTIDDININSFNISHDAIDPHGFNLSSNNSKISIATDFGFYDDKIIETLSDSDLVVLESNYESGLLEISKYPYYLKKRIASEKGHLSNNQMAELLNILSEKGVRNFIFGHLSKENNHPDIVHKVAENEFKKLDLLEDVNFEIAPREDTGNSIII